MQLSLLLGSYKYNGPFHVLKGDVPLILGMDFLVKVSPSVNWKHKQVTCYVGSKKYILPTCNIDNLDTICDDN